ncbi:MAG: hypothetical protein HKN56_04000 [Gammaproteobacteria bacterium]|nr:hypothetical protein [Gammaproteobacteria bacterium]NND54117.1 hypothetical protein [Gammaproteobacteria bacterium]
MKIDPKSRAVTSFFMVAAVIVMLALAWSVARDNSAATDPAKPAETRTLNGE